MPLDAARAFIREIIADTKYREQLDSADAPEKRLELARQRGFDFTQHELEDAVAEVASAPTVGDLVDVNSPVDDEKLAHTFGRLVDLQDHQLVPHYAHGPTTNDPVPNGPVTHAPGHCEPGPTAAQFFSKDGEVKILDVKPRQKTDG